MNEKVKDLQGKAFDPFDLNANGIEKVSDEKKMDSESFDPFNHSRGVSPDPFPDDEIDPRMEDPWSAEPESPSQNPSWLNSANVDTSFDSSQNPSWFNSTDVDISFESSLQYSASLTVGETLRSDVSNSTPDDSVRADIGEFETRDPFATDSDIFMKEAAKKEAQHTINLKLEERLSILFDGVTKVPSCRVIGSIYLKNRTNKLNSFCLTVRDRKGLVERWEEQNHVCLNVTASLPHLALDPSDQVFRISLKDRDRMEAPIVAYSCDSRLKPIPILLKTKIKLKDKRCWVGIRLRANPSNRNALTKIALLMVVPPDIDGERVTMSRRGGVWDGIKRTLAWRIEKLLPGETIDIQTQFGCNAGGSLPKFPVLVRGDGKALFSKIELSTEYTEDGSEPVNLHVDQSSRILYRKV